MIAALERVDPRDLVVPTRLDLAIKWRFFLHLRDGADPDSAQLYMWHIEARTGGREPRSTKTTLAHYLIAARGLIASMQAVGFDSQCPVRVGSNGRLMDGAHRIACAIALDLKGIAVARAEKPGVASAWDADYLLRGGISSADLQQVIVDHSWMTK